MCSFSQNSVSANEQIFAITQAANGPSNDEMQKARFERRLQSLKAQNMAGLDLDWSTYLQDTERSTDTAVRPLLALYRKVALINKRSADFPGRRATAVDHADPSYK